MKVEEKFEEELENNEESNEKLVQEEYEIPEKANYEEELIKIIRSDDPTPVKLDKLDDYHENDIASALEYLDSERKKEIIFYFGSRQSI